jgi:hypothetical protein
MKYELLIELLPYLEKYEASDKKQDLNSFISWMQEHPEKETVSDSDLYKSVPLQGTINAKISQLIALMHKYVRFYFKKGMKDSMLQTTEDFGFLATLATFGDMKKNALITKNTSEFTSGMEVIKRLERNDLISSFPDPDDKRAKRVMITPKGKGVFFQALPLIKKVGEIATGPLSKLEKDQLVDLLQKLNIFHNTIFHDEKTNTIDNILEKYVLET